MDRLRHFLIVLLCLAVPLAGHASIGGLADLHAVAQATVAPAIGPGASGHHETSGSRHHEHAALRAGAASAVALITGPAGGKATASTHVHRHGGDASQHPGCDCGCGTGACTATAAVLLDFSLSIARIAPDRYLLPIFSTGYRPVASAPLLRPPIA